MATRFRKHSTRKTRRSKSLKTRKHRGGNFVTGLFQRKKNTTGNMMASAGNATAFLGIKKKGFFNKMKNFFTRKEKQDGGKSILGMFSKSPLSSSPSPPSSPKANTTKKNKNGTFQLYMGNVSKEYGSRNAFTKGRKWNTYLTKLQGEITTMKNKKPNDFIAMKQSLHAQLNQNDKILKQMEKELTPTDISMIKTKLGEIRTLLA